MTARRAEDTASDDLLALLMKAHDTDGTSLTDQQIRDEAITFLVAGHETTANALAWTWYLLGQHPTIYTQAQAEVDQVLGGRTPTQADLPKLGYILQIFKEAMRLYSPAWGITRQTLEPIELGPYHLPAGALLLICTYMLHRQPDIFPDPERFDPGRFTAEREAVLPPCSYLPFGAGPRTCVGNHFALMQAHLILAHLLQAVKFELVPGQHIEPEPLITLRPKGGIKMIVRRREVHPERGPEIPGSTIQESITKRSISA